MTPAAVPAAGAHIWHDGVTYEDAAREFQRRNAELLALLLPADLPDGPVLEVGCGTGFLTEALVAHGVAPSRITAVDVSASMIAEARAKPALAGARFVCARFEDFAPEQPSALVASSAALHWLYPAYADAFARLRSALAPGGTVLLALAGRTADSDAFDAFVAARMPAGAPAPSTPFRDRRLTPARLAELAAGAGLAVDDAFVVSRSAVMPAIAYARWLMASGGPWQATEADFPARVAELAAALGDDEPMEVGHWTLVARLSAAPVREGAAR
jgi:malonyl-CoA O-methyltransferase